MEYLGFKSTNDPLFQADKTMMRLKDKAGDKEVEFYEGMSALVLFYDMNSCAQDKVSTT